MNDDRDIVLFRIDRKVGLLMLAALAVVIGGFALAQQLTLTTSYPVPSGIYNQLMTTGNSGSVPANTTFNLNAGNTILVPPTNAAGNVGIGTVSPHSPAPGGAAAGNLDVNDAYLRSVGSWASQMVPSGAVMFFNAAACPSGWTAFTAAQGRYIVGMPGGGTLGLTAGTALGDGEQRQVPIHLHGGRNLWESQCDPLRGICSGNMGGDVNGGAWTWISNEIMSAGDYSAWKLAAPYVELLACQKQ